MAGELLTTLISMLPRPRTPRLPVERSFVICNIPTAQPIQKEKIRENKEKIKLNKQLPWLVGNVVEVRRQLK